MTRSQPHIDSDFLLVFHALVITASASTATWMTTEPDLYGSWANWLPAVVWIGLVASGVQFAANRAWWRPAALAFAVSMAMLAASLRGA